MTALFLKGLLASPAVRVAMIGAAALAGLLVWHKADKAAAIRAARSDCVATVELTAAKAELARLELQAATLEAANEWLRGELEKANAAAAEAVADLANYVSITDDTVDAGLLEKLHNE